MPVGLQIVKGENEPTMWRTPTRLYLNADKTEVVPEGPLAASLLSAVGRTVSDDDCKKYGLGPYAEPSLEDLGVVGSLEDTTQNATSGVTRAEGADVTTDTEPDEEGPQIDSHDAEFYQTPEIERPPVSDVKPRRKK